MEDQLRFEPVPRRQTRQVMVGAVAVGGDAAVSVQSMTTTSTADAKATCAQIKELADAGCEIVRVAVPNKDALAGFEACAHLSPVPLVADIHFDYRLAIEAIRRGAAAIRLNPGNIGSFSKVDAVIEAAGEAHIPIRIGVNAGSLERSLEARDDLSHEDKLVASAVAFVEHFEKRSFTDIVLSVKTHSVKETVAVNRRLVSELPHIPLHLGVTEAGGFSQATVKNAVALGILLSEGIGNTIRVSITAPPVEEVRVAWQILSAVGLRRRGPEIVSCPTCARCTIDLVALENEVEERLARLGDALAPITIAVMGCEVNGPGEAREADIGIAGGKGRATLFAKGEKIAVVPQEAVVDSLFAEIKNRYI